MKSLKKSVRSQSIEQVQMSKVIRQEVALESRQHARKTRVESSISTGPGRFKAG